MYIRIVFFKLILQIYTTLLSTRPQPLFGRHLKKNLFFGSTVYHTQLKRGKNSNLKCVFVWLHDYGHGSSSSPMARSIFGINFKRTAAVCIY